VTTIFANKVNLEMENRLKIVEHQNKLFKTTFNVVIQQLALLKLKDCPEEEKINIPLEVLEALEEIRQYWS
jgi:hypothetical protein